MLKKAQRRFIDWWHPIRELPTRSIFWTVHHGWEFQQWGQPWTEGFFEM